MPIVKTPNGTLYSGFKEEYVSQVATWLLEEWRATEEDLVRETDTSYTRGTARFGRQKERISLYPHRILQPMFSSCLISSPVPSMHHLSCLKCLILNTLHKYKNLPLC